MSNGKIIWEIHGQRFLAIPRDHREGAKCIGCYFAFHGRRNCPVDKSGNRLCDFGHGMRFKRLAILPAKPARPEQLMLIGD